MLARRVVGRAFDLGRCAFPLKPYTTVFVHIPKTAGMSLRRVLLRQSPVQRRYRILCDQDFDAFAALPPAQRDRFEVIEGHVYYGVHELVGRECRYITMLRDPVERVLSWYSYVRENDWHHLYERIAGEDLSLGNCLQQSVSIELDNCMVRYLAGHRHLKLPFGKVTSEHLEEAKANLERFTAVGICERFDESLELFANVLGWRGARPRRVNSTRARLHRGHVDAETLALVESQNELDAALYRYAQALFDRHCKAAGCQRER